MDSGDGPVGGLENVPELPNEDYSVGMPSGGGEPHAPDGNDGGYPPVVEEQGGASASGGFDGRNLPSAHHDTHGEENHGVDSFNGTGNSDDVPVVHDAGGDDDAKYVEEDLNERFRYRFDDAAGGLPEGGAGDGLPDGGDGMGGADGGEGFEDGVTLDGLDYLPADHPLLARVQKAMKAQLENDNLRVVGELREKQEQYAKTKTERETLGVDLYNFQEQLASLQRDLAAKHESFNAIVARRGASEEQLGRIDEVMAVRKAERDKLARKQVEAQQALDQLNITLKQTEDFNRTVESEIKVTRRAAYGEESQMQKLEKDKQRQDKQIDELHENLRSYRDQIRSYASQIEAQKEETRNARTALVEASRAMEVIVAEKRDFVAKWRSSLLGVAQRDKALARATEALEEHRERIRQLNLSSRGYQLQAEQVRSKNEMVQDILQRSEAQIESMKTEVEANEEQRNLLTNRYSVLRASLQQTEAKLRAARLQERQVESRIQTAHKAYERLMEQKQKLDDQIHENVSERDSIDKGAENVWKMALKLKQRIHETELKIGQVENEVSRIDVDALNTGAHSKELAATLSVCLEEISKKEDLIKTYESTLKKNNDKTEKRQVYLAMLNRKYDKLTSNVEAENTGPLEATIKNLKKEIAQLVKECLEMQRRWIKMQTELVTVVSDTNELEESIVQLEGKSTVWVQKQLRLTRTLANNQADVKQLSRSVDKLHKEMARLNKFIDNNKVEMKKLENDNYATEMEFMQRLKDLEAKSVELDGAVVAVQQAKEQIMANLVEVEKQIMLWEKKIQLEKETQEALDPQYGQTEIKSMQKEIHRMTLRLSHLKRHQEKMIQEMERMVSRRENIKLSRLSSRRNGRSGRPSQAALRRQVVNLQSSLKEQVNEIKRLKEQMALKDGEHKQLAEALAGAQTDWQQTQEQFALVDRQLKRLHFKHQVNVETAKLWQERARVYDLALRDEYKVSSQPQELRRELAAAVQDAERLKDVIQRLREEQPKYAEELMQLMQLL